MHSSLFRYIWQQTRKEQIWIIGVILVSSLFTYWSLDIPKQIVNGPIQARGFETENAVQTYFKIRIPLPEFVSPSGGWELLHGFDLNRTHSLVALSAAYFALVIINGLFKFYVNTYKGRLGERMLQQLRYDLVDRVLRFPPGEFRRVKPAEIATMIKDEVEPLGGFIGDAYVQPVLLGTNIVTSLFFIVQQNLMLGLIAIGLLVFQGVLIPRLRRKQLVLGRQRQLTSRALAGRIGEIIDDIASIHTNNTSNYQRAEIAARLNAIFAIRFALYQWKFFVKFLNNTLAQFTPFLFYMVGGFLAIMGHLNIGQLVGVINAYKDLPSPMKDLIDWDQQRLDVEVKYNQVMEQFSVDESVELLPTPDYDEEVPHLSGELVLSGVTVNDTSGARLLDNCSLRVGIDEIVAIEGSSTAGGETVIDVAARLVAPLSGRVALGGRDLREWPYAVTGQRISYVSGDMYFPQSDIAEALLAGMRHKVQLKKPTTQRHHVIKGHGNALDVESDWVDYGSAGASGPDDIVPAIGEILRVVDLEGDVVSLGLNLQLRDPDEAVQQRFVQARADFRDRLEQAGLLAFVEPFDPERFNEQASIAENIVFGTPIDSHSTLRVLGSHPTLRQVLSKEGLDADLFAMGRDIATTILEVFGELEGDSPLFDQLSLMSPEQFADFRAAIKRVGSKPIGQVAAADQAIFLDLAFGYIEARDRLGLLDDVRKRRILSVRHLFHEALGDKQEEIAFYDPARYNLAASIKDNILMGRVAFGVAEADVRVTQVIKSLIDDFELRPLVFEAGLGFNIGSAGKRLSVVQREKLALARALLRRPDLLLAHRPLGQLDGRAQQAILQRVLALAKGEDGRPGFGVLWNIGNPESAGQFPRVIRMDQGKVVEDRPEASAEPPVERTPEGVTA